MNKLIVITFLTIGSVTLIGAAKFRKDHENSPF